MRRRTVFHKRDNDRARSFRQPKVYNGNLSVKKKDFAFSKQTTKIIACFLAMIALIYLFFFSSVFVVKDIIVEGNEYISSSDIIAALPEKENIFRFNFKENRHVLIDKFPEIKDAVFYRGIPNAVKVVILERDTQIIWQSGDAKYLLSSEGEVARKIESEDGLNLPKVVDLKNVPVKVGESLVSAHFINFINNVYSRFYEVTNIKPTNFDIEETTFDVTLHTDANFAVKLNTLRSSKTQLDNLKNILVEKRPDIREYVDLRIDGWAYYK